MTFRAKLIMLLGLTLVCGGCNRLTRQKLVLDKDTVITLSRTSCYGYCPTYTVTISGDGNVVLEGSKPVNSAKEGNKSSQPIGPIHSQLNQEQLQHVVAEFERINFFSLKDAYNKQGSDCPDYGTDAPSAVTTIKTNGRTKSVAHYSGCTGTETLKELSTLEQEIDMVAGTSRWVN